MRQGIHGQILRIFQWYMAMSGPLDVAHPSISPSASGGISEAFQILPHLRRGYPRILARLPQFPFSETVNPFPQTCHRPPTLFTPGAHHAGGDSRSTMLFQNRRPASGQMFRSVNGISIPEQACCFGIDVCFGTSPQLMEHSLDVWDRRWAKEHPLTLWNRP